MRTLFLALALISSAAADRWLLVRSGPFEIYSSAGDRAARERLNALEQFREAPGATLASEVHRTGNRVSMRGKLNTTDDLVCMWARQHGVANPV